MNYGSWKQKIKIYNKIIYKCYKCNKRKKGKKKPPKKGGIEFTLGGIEFTFEGIEFTPIEFILFFYYLSGNNYRPQ